VLHGVHGAVKQDFVGLLGADVRQRIIDLLVGAGDREASSAASRIMTGIRRCIITSGKNRWSCASGQTKGACRRNRYTFCKVASAAAFNNSGVSLWITIAEHRVACNQNFCPCPHHLRNRVQCDAPSTSMR